MRIMKLTFLDSVHVAMGTERQIHRQKFQLFPSPSLTGQNVEQLQDFRWQLPVRGSHEPEGGVREDPTCQGCHLQVLHDMNGRLQRELCQMPVLMLSCTSVDQSESSWSCWTSSQSSFAVTAWLSTSWVGKSLKFYSFYLYFVSQFVWLFQFSLN